ncbi:aromatic prenyltransferase [Aspergillus desertorum]
MTAMERTVSHKRSWSDGGTSTQAWKILSQTLPSRGPDVDAWWQLTGRHLAVLLDAAAYPIDRQYECLLYHYHYAAPYLGPAPREGASPATWKSTLQLDGIPFEFSWKWNTPGGEPDVRFGLEPIGPMAGTALDPLNHSAMREVLYKLSSAVPGADLTWTHHFLATLFDHDYAKYTRKAAAIRGSIGTSLVYSLEFQRESTGLKTYFHPRKLDQQAFLDIPRWETSFPGATSKFPLPHSCPRIPKHEPGRPTPQAICLSVDNCSPAKGRIKWYFNSPHTSFSAVREIMTLGGRIAHTETRGKQFTELFDLLRTLTEQATDFLESSEFPYVPNSGDSVIPNLGDVPDMLKGCIYFFDIAPGKDLPSMKIYFLTLTGGLNRGAAGSTGLHFGEPSRRLRTIDGWMIVGGC